MKLSARLKAVSNLISKDSTIVDIGCDHAYLPIYLIENKISKKAYAIDSKIGPLNQGIENIKENNMEGVIIPVLSDGLNDFEFTDYDTITICGMGGDTIISIIDNEKIKNDSTLILEANTNQKELREYLNKNNYEFIDEILLKDKGHFYMIMKVIKKDKVNKLSNIELEFGPVILKNKPKELYDYLSLQISILEKGLEHAKKKDEILSKINYLKGVAKL